MTLTATAETKSHTSGIVPLTRPQLVGTLTGLLLAALLAAIDQTIVGTAEPRIIAQLSGHGTVLFLDLEALSPAHLKAVIARRDAFDRGVRRVLEEGMAAGVFADGDPKLLAFALFGAVNWIPRWYSPDGPASSQAIADLFGDFFVAGLRRSKTLR